MSGFQRTPALTAASTWVAGVILAETTGLPPVIPVVLLVVLGGVLIAMMVRAPGADPPIVLAFLFSICFGATLHCVQQHLRHPLPDRCPARTVAVTGVLAGDPEGPPERRRCLLEAETIDSSGTPEPLHGSVLVSLRHARREQPDSLLRYGMRVRFSGRLERPARAQNPGEFDRRGYYDANGIGYLMTVRLTADAEILDSTGGSWAGRSIVMPVRRSVLRTVDGLVGGEEGELLKGILLGERGGIGNTVREAFTTTGTAHVLAVSGSNVAVVAGAVFLLFGFLRVGRVARGVATSLVVVLYMLVTGSQPPVARASIMAIVLLAAHAGGRARNALNALGVAAVIMLVLDTRQVFDVGFQLSFAAVLSLVLFTGGAASRVRALWPASRLAVPLRAALLVAVASLAATVGTLPLTALHFGRVSIIGLVANVLVVPLVGLGVMLGGLMAAVAPFWQWGAEAYAVLIRLLMYVTMWFTTIAAEVPGASMEILGFRWVDMVPFYGGLLLLRAWVRRSPLVRILLPVTLAGVLLAVVWPASPAAGARPGVLRVSMIDVGQGDAILVEPPGREAILIDAGPWSPRFDAGARTVVPFLRRRGIRRLGLFLPTHAHADHLGGAAAVIRSVGAEKVVRMAQGTDAPHELLYRRTRAAAGTGLPLNARPGEVLDADSSFALEVLWAPPSASPALLEPSDPAFNEGSLVCRARFGAVTFLFMGDAGADVEARLVETYGPLLRADVLKVGHHGSASASTAAFLNAVAPSLALISVGRGNGFGHPAASVLARLDSLGIEVHRTDEEGAVILETDGRTVEVVEWR